MKNLHVDMHEKSTDIEFENIGITAVIGRCPSNKALKALDTKERALAGATGIGVKDKELLKVRIEFGDNEVVSRLGISEQEIEALKAQNIKLIKEIEELKLSVKQLEYKNKIIKIAKALEGKQETTNAKLKINELLREVDRCIGLLND